MTRGTSGGKRFVTSAIAKFAVVASALCVATMSLSSYGVTTHRMTDTDISYSGGFITTSGVLVFPGKTLADLEGYSFWGTMGGRLVALAVAIVLIGVGACLSVRMRLIPNPGDGVVLALSERTGWKLGASKNAFDIANVLLALAIGLAARGQIVGVGIGTILAMLGVGRVVDLTGRLLAPLINRLTPKE